MKKMSGRRAEGGWVKARGMEGWGRKVKVAERSDGDLIGGGRGRVKRGLRREAREGGRSEDEEEGWWI